MLSFLQDDKLGKVIGLSTVLAPSWTKVIIFFILLLPLGWIPGFFGFFTHKGKRGKHRNKKANKEDGNKEETLGFGEFLSLVNFGIVLILNVQSYC